jgi:hypothetical protein
VNWYDEIVRLAKACKALEDTLREQHPDLYFKTTQRDDGQFRSVIGLNPEGGGPRMSLLSEYYLDASEDPDHLRDYAERILTKLRKEQ